MAFELFGTALSKETKATELIEGKPKKYWQEGAVYFEEMGRFDKAAECLEHLGRRGEARELWGKQGEKIFATPDKNYLEAAKCFEKAGDEDAARECYQTELVRNEVNIVDDLDAKTKTENLYSLEKLALCYMKLGQVDKAQDIYVHLLGLPRGNFSIEQQATFYGGMGDHVTAEKMYEIAAREFEKSHNYQRAAECFTQAKWRKEQREVWQRALQYYQGVKLVGVKNNGLANAYAALGEREMAKKYYKKSAEYELKQGYPWQAVILFVKAEEWARAQEAYEKAIKKESSSYARILMCEEIGDFERARKFQKELGYSYKVTPPEEIDDWAKPQEKPKAERAERDKDAEFMDRRPESYWLEALKYFEDGEEFDQAAKCCEKLGRLDEAKKWHQRAGDDSMNKGHFWEAGQQYELAGLEEQARGAYRGYIEKNSAFNYYSDFSTNERLWDASLKIGDVAGAELIGRKLRDRLHERGDYAHLGAVYQKLGDEASARESYLKAARAIQYRCPECAARYYKAAGDPAMENEMLRKALEEARWHRDFEYEAQLYEKMGDRKMARSMWSKAVQEQGFGFDDTYHTALLTEKFGNDREVEIAWGKTANYAERMGDYIVALIGYERIGDFERARQMREAVLHKGDFIHMPLGVGAYPYSMTGKAMAESEIERALERIKMARERFSLNFVPEFME